MTGYANSVVGFEALGSNVYGAYNVAVGFNALVSNVGSSSDSNEGGYNVAVGSFSLTSNISGPGNVAVGYNALYANTSGANTTAVGPGAGYANTTGGNNVFVGDIAGVNSTTGNNNTFVGYWSGLVDPPAGQPATPHSNATAIGYHARIDANNAMVLGGTGADAINVGIGTTQPAATLHVYGGTAQFNGVNGAGTIVIDPTNGQILVNNQPVLVTPGGNSTFVPVITTGQNNMGTALFASLTTGSGDTALGSTALQNLTTGSFDTGIGNGSLASVTTGQSNVAVGNSTLNAIQTDSANTAIGDSALYQATGGSNVAIGANAGRFDTGGTASQNIYIGAEAGHNGTPNLTNATAIGYAAQVTQSNSLILGGTGANAVSVGIGTPAPVATLEVNGNGQIDGVVTVYDPVGQSATISLDPVNGAAYQVPVRVLPAGDIGMGGFNNGPKPGQP